MFELDHPQIGQPYHDNADPSIKEVTLLGPKTRGAFESGITSALESNGIVVNRSEVLNSRLVNVDRIILLGPMQHHVEQLKSLSNYRNSLPPVRVWYTEQVPNPSFPAIGARFLSVLRQRVDSHKLGYRLPGTRFRAVGEMISLNQIASNLAIHTFSDTNTVFLRRMGLPAYTTPIGTHEVFGRRSNIRFRDRRIQVLFLGSTRDRRRSQIINRLQEHLKNKGINFSVRSEQNPVYSDERTGLLGNTIIFLAIARQRYDDHHFRLILGGTNRVLVMVEETIETSKGVFTPGVDYLEATIEKMPDVIQHFLDKPEEAESIAENLHKKVNNAKLSDQISELLM